jgi:hypothetical protein
VIILEGAYYSSTFLDLPLLFPDANGTDGRMQSCVHKVSNRIIHGHEGNVNGGKRRRMEGELGEVSFVVWCSVRT